MTEVMGTMSKKMARAWTDIDAMSPEWRQCVHEYGYAIVHSAQEAGVKTPGALHQLVREIWDGARGYFERRKPGETLDWLLIQSGAGVSLPGLSRILENENLVIAPKTPTKRMILASMNELSNHDVICTKFRKHELRLSAAMRVAAVHFGKQNSGAA